MKREGWFWKIIAPTGAIIPYSHEYDAGYGINQHDACIKLRIGQKCFCLLYTSFCRRFFAQQFKRSCLPDGPKVGSVAVAPRGDLRMPSDACATLWMEELNTLS